MPKIGRGGRSCEFECRIQTEVLEDLDLEFSMPEDRSREIQEWIPRQAFHQSILASIDAQTFLLAPLSAGRTFFGGKFESVLAIPSVPILFGFLLSSSLSYDPFILHFLSSRMTSSFFSDAITCAPSFLPSLSYPSRVFLPFVLSRDPR